MLAPDFEAIPGELRSLSRWVLWKGKKVPYCAAAADSTASATNPSTWAAFDTARASYEEGGYSGVGFVLNGDGVLGVDLDKCVTTKPSRAAMELLEHIGCRYIELSPSGKGLRGFGFGEPLPKGWRGVVNGINVELYSNARYLTVTGHALRNEPLSQLPGFAAVAEKIHRPPTQETQETQGTQETQVIPPLLAGGSFSLPTAAGQRNDLVFTLARQLKGLHPDATLKDLRPIVREWHKQALPTISTKDFDTTWGDFARAWNAVRHPTGAVLQSIVKDIENIELPDMVREFEYGGRTIRLIRICMALAAHHAPNPFYLGSRTAGELLGCHFTDAAKLLNALVADGVLQLVSKGVLNKKVSEYRVAF